MKFISIIVPTRNRGDTLRFALNTLTAIDDDHVEFIISDNASADDTRDIVMGRDDPRIRYVHTGRSLAASQNWEFALSHARGDWVGYLGDDDGMLPDACARLRAVIAETGARAVRSGNCNYMWPSLAPDGKARLSIPLGRNVHVVDARCELMRVLNGYAHYTRLPVVYNGGFAERALFDEARDASGNFFRAQLPDVYSGVVLAYLLDRYVWSDIPFAVNGASIHSTGSALFSRSSDPARRRALEVFLREENIPFHPGMPLNRDGSIPKSLQALVLESWHHARDLFPAMPPLTPEQQLCAVMRQPTGLTPIAEWVGDFAAQYGLDARAIARRTMARRLGNRAKAVRDRAWTTDWHSDLSPAHPVDTVDAATRLAAEVIGKARSPTRVALRNLVRIGVKLLARGVPGRHRATPTGPDESLKLTAT